MASLRVAAPRDVIRDAANRMEAVLRSYPFTDARIKAAAAAFVERYRNSTANRKTRNRKRSVSITPPFRAGPSAGAELIMSSLAIAVAFAAAGGTVKRRPQASR